MRAAIYARYSSHEQDGGESIDFQLRKCRNYIEAEGWTVPEENVFVDRAKSGTSTVGREAFNRMIALAKVRPPPLEVVVVYSTSRFGRNMEQSIVNRAFLRKQGIDVHFVSQPRIEGDGLTGHVGKLIENVFAWTDELQSIQTGEAAFEGQREVTSKGFHGGGKAPYGYQRKKVLDPDGKTGKDGSPVEYVTFEVVLDEAEVVRRIFDEYAGGLGYKRIAAQLNKDGVRSPGGGTWDISGVRSLLLNEAYLGHRVWNKTRRNKRVQRGSKKAKPRDQWIISEAAHEAIVTQEVWDAVQEKFGKIRMNLKGNRGRPAGSGTYMLSGLLKCEECGGSYVMFSTKKKGGKVRYYRCSKRANRGTSVCTNSRFVRQDTVERAALKVLSEQLLTQETVQAILDEYAAQREVETDEPGNRQKEIQAGIRIAEKEIKNLADGIRAAGPVRELVKQLRAAELRHETLSAELKVRQSHDTESISEIDPKDVMEAIHDLKKTLSHATPQEVKTLLKDNIREIRIPKNGVALLEANPEGLLATLGCINLVTPRGVDAYATLAAARNPALFRIELPEAA